MPVTLLDCTLRDGSYAVDFQFTAKFTTEYCKVVNDLGFKYVEVGHGMGIGASDKIRRAISSDLEYAESAQIAKTHSKWGMFAQPAFSRITDISKLCDVGMDFVRVGVDINEAEQGLKYVEQLKQFQIEVFVNLMKSYTVDPKTMYSIMERFVELGVTGVYLVDSAGGMTRSDVEEYASELLVLSNRTKVGFHGHDNLGLAISNSLFLAEIGFDLIDCTMQGIGRSSGNASAEKLLALLNRCGYESSIDLIKLLKAGENLIRPKLPVAGHSGLDTFAGYALFHTSYMENLLKVSRDMGVDPYALMQEHCLTNLTSGSVEDFIPSGKKLVQDGILLDAPLPIDKYVGNEQS
jgi:4-hydroxy 2-oxovalerate aldolase